MNWSPDVRKQENISPYSIKKRRMCPPHNHPICQCHLSTSLQHPAYQSRNNSGEKKHYFEVCSAAQAQWKTSCSLTIFGRFRWAATTYSELPVVSEEYLQINRDINQSLTNNTSNHLCYGFHTRTRNNFPFMVTHFPFISRIIRPRQLRASRKCKTSSQAKNKIIHNSSNPEELF